MAGQSLAMGEAFGKGFQYGKRKISSMSNEDFNKMDFKMLSQSIATDYKDMIPSLEESIKASDRLQTAVFQELGDLIKSIPDEILKFFDTAVGGPTNTSGITQTSYSGSVGIPLGPKAGTPEDQFGVAIDLGEAAIKSVLPESLGGTPTREQKLAAKEAQRAKDIAKNMKHLAETRGHRYEASNVRIQNVVSNPTPQPKKRRASQSQIMERDRQIKELDKAYQLVQSYTKSQAYLMTNPYSSTSKTKTLLSAVTIRLRNAESAMQALQLKLVKFIDQYDFKTIS